MPDPREARVDLSDVARVPFAESPREGRSCAPLRREAEGDHRGVVGRLERAAVGPHRGVDLGEEGWEVLGPVDAEEGLEAGHAEGLAGLVLGLDEAVRVHRGPREAADDATMVALRYSAVAFQERG